MAVFKYEVIDGLGNLSRGSIEAENERTAVERLRKMGLLVTDIGEARKSFLDGLFRFRRGIGIGQLGLFTRQLTAMLEAGIPLVRSIFTLSRQTANPTLSYALGEVGRSIEGGMSFSESLKLFPEIFPPVFVNMVQAGEAGGSLATVLRHLSQQLERDKNIRDNIRSATIYPAVVTGFSLVILLVMLIVVVPMFIRFFPAGMELPLLTRVIIGISSGLRNYWFLLLLAIALLWLVLRYYLHTLSGRRVWDRMKLKLPVIGSLVHKVAIARFALTLSTLLNGGIPVLRALESAGPASGNLMVEEAVEVIKQEIQEGKSIAGPMGKLNIFPPMVVQMTAVGEESGDLPALLMRVAGFFEEEVTAMAKGLSSLLEPVLIVVVGGMVAFVVVSMYLPIFYTVTSIGM